jgi:NTE family protein
MMARETLLGRVSVLAGLPDELRERLAAEAKVVRLPAGAWLMRKGDVAESLYVVRSGRLEVVDDGPPETVVRVLRRGEVLGELALLKGGRRSASVRAQRDSELLEVGSTEFEALVQEAPSYALGLLRTMVAQLAVSRIPMSATALPRTVAVVGLDRGAPVLELAERLAVALGRHGSVAHLRAQPGVTLTDTDMASMLDRAERTNDRVLLTSDETEPGRPWTAFSLREADLVVAVSSGAPTPLWSDQRAALLGCELIVSAPPSPSGWSPCWRRARCRCSAGRSSCRTPWRSPPGGWRAAPSASYCPAVGRGPSRTSACSRSCARPA